jgi:hypothetical protein
MNNPNLINRAKELIKTNTSNGGAMLMLKIAADESESDLLDGLKEVASQYNDKFSRKDAVRTFGLELCNIASSLFPDTEPHLPINLDEKKIKGGKADDISLEDIAKKFSVTVASLKKELKAGIEVELEHTKNRNTAKDIAMDHLTEMPDYYTRLSKMESQATKYWDKKEIKETKVIIKQLLHKALNLK